MMGLSVDRAGVARALAMAGARHWPKSLGPRPDVEVVSSQALRAALSAWGTATMGLLGNDEAVNVDRAQVAALGMANGGALTGLGAAETARAGEDSGSGTSGTREVNARDGEQARPVLSAESRPVLPEVLSWLREQGAPQLGSPGRRAHMAALAEAVKRRTEVGTERYGVPLHSHAGRDVLRDLGEELVDAVQYATQALMELDEDEGADDAAAWLESVRYHAAEAWCDMRRVGER